ncbi:MAG: hypothetical protein M1600_02765 [Firmicutes bacterium]|nr:hypothetical protein [Bacillota bacterium]
MEAPAIVLNLAVLWDVDAHWHLRFLRIGPPQAEHERFGLTWHFAVAVDSPEGDDPR